MSNRPSRARLLTFFCLMWAIFHTAMPAEETRKLSRIFHPLPDGFSMYLTIMGTSQYDLTSPHPEIPNCSGQICAGDYFFDEILGLDDNAKAAYHQEALDLWSERFGIDPTDPDMAGRVITIPFYKDPRNELRAYSMARTRIHQAGWLVDDGGWMLIVVDPEGIELGGEFSGVHAGPNTVFVRGTYTIEARTRNGHHLADIVLEYKTRAPIAFPPGAPVIGNCEVFESTIDGHPTTWGSGHGQPSILLFEQENGETKLSYRNIITFGPDRGFGEPLIE